AMAAGAALGVSWELSHPCRVNPTDHPKRVLDHADIDRFRRGVHLRSPSCRMITASVQRRRISVVTIATWLSKCNGLMKYRLARSAIAAFASAACRRRQNDGRQPVESGLRADPFHLEVRFPGIFGSKTARLRRRTGNEPPVRRRATSGGVGPPRHGCSSPYRE